MQRKKPLNQSELLNIAFRIVEASQALTPFRFDFKPMVDVIPEQVPDTKTCKRFYDEQRVITNILCGLGSYESNHLNLTKKEYVALRLYEATIARELGVTNCEVATAHALRFLLENKIDIPFTVLSFSFYEHVFAVLGGNFTSRELLSLSEKQDTLENVIIIDLWNKKNPIMTIYQFQSVMEDLLRRENLLIHAYPNSTTKMDLTTIVDFHIPSIAQYQDVYDYYQSKPGFTLDDHKKLIQKRFSEKTEPDYKTTRLVVPKSISEAQRSCCNYSFALTAGLTLFAVAAAANKYTTRPNLIP